MSNHFLQNGEQKLHLLEGPPLPGPPLLHIPGMFGRAEHCIAEMLALPHRKSFALSLRGRGQSDSGKSYSLEDHVSDVITALEFIGEPSHICAHSIGNVFAIGAAYVRPDLVQRLCLVDRGLHIKLGKKWTQRCLKKAPKEISKKTIRGLAEDLPTNAWPLLRQVEAPICFFRGKGKDAHTTDEDISQFRKLSKGFHLVELPQSDHWPSKGDDYNLYIDTIDQFTRY